MNSLVNPDIPWEFKAFIIVLIGLIFSTVTLKTPHKWLAKLSTKPFCSPNWITFWSLVSFHIGFAIYLTLGTKYFAAVCVGFWLMLFGSILDVMDGKMAASMVEFDIPRSPASKAFGECFDPAADKLRQLPYIGYLAFHSIVNPLIVIPIIVTDVLGTLLRAPFIQWKPFSYLKRFQRQSKASPIGKVKGIALSFCMMFSIPFDQKWIQGGLVLNILLFAVLVLAMLSVLSRIHISKGIDKVVDALHAYFGHRRYDSANISPL